MYNLSTRNLKKGILTYLPFLIVGVFFLIILIVNYNIRTREYREMDASTPSTRVEVVSYQDSERVVIYTPVYYYTVDGKQYMCYSSSSSSVYPSTANQTVYYNSDNPASCETEYSASSRYILLATMLAPTAFIVYALFNILKIIHRLGQIRILNLRGRLVKNLPYRLEKINLDLNNTHAWRPVVEYSLPSGSVVELAGDPRYDNKTHDYDGLVDLVIDEQNPENYFVDFEINRKSGNLESDYYISPADRQAEALSNKPEAQTHKTTSATLRKPEQNSDFDLNDTL